MGGYPLIGLYPFNRITDVNSLLKFSESMTKESSKLLTFCNRHRMGEGVGSTSENFELTLFLCACIY